MVTMFPTVHGQPDALTDVAGWKTKAALMEQAACDVAHELNNALQPIAAFVDLLRASLPDRSDPELLGFCDAIRASVRDATALTQQLRHLARPSVDDLGLVEIGPAVQEAVLLLQWRIRETGTALSLRLPSHPITVLGHRARLKQVVTNLVLNALDALEEVEIRTLSIDVTALDTAVSIQVADSGAGIHPIHVPHIFDPFFTTKPPDRGTGLGLSLCRSIVEQHGGTIEVRSTRGTGTVFEVRLPRAAVTPPAEPRRMPVAAPPTPTAAVAS